METYGVIFDMDGVLVDSYAPHYESWKISCKKRGFPIDDQMYAGLFGQTFESFVKALATRTLSCEEVADWYWEKEALYREIIADDFPENPGASELLAALHEDGFMLAIGSSGPKENVQCVLDNMPGAGLFTTTVNGDECEKGKPDPEVFLKAAERLGISPGNCLVIEDSIHGLQAARGAGMAAVGMTGTAAVEELDNNSDLVIESLVSLEPQKIRDLIERNRS